MTVAELKRRVVVGVKLDLVHFSGWSPGPRTVTKVNSVGFGLTNSEGKTSFCDWPKASELIEKPNGFTIRSDWSYWKNGEHIQEIVDLLNYTFVV